MIILIEYVLFRLWQKFFIVRVNSPHGALKRRLFFGADRHLYLILVLGVLFPERYYMHGILTWLHHFFSFSGHRMEVNYVAKLSCITRRNNLPSFDIHHKTAEVRGAVQTMLRFILLYFKRKIVFFPLQFNLSINLKQQNSRILLMMSMMKIENKRVLPLLTHILYAVFLHRMTLSLIHCHFLLTLENQDFLLPSLQLIIHYSRLRLIIKFLLLRLDTHNIPYTENGHMLFDSLVGFVLY